MEARSSCAAAASALASLPHLPRGSIDVCLRMPTCLHRGDAVLLKPNVAWDRTADQAATTNPAVLAAVSSLCRDAGASKVLVADATIHEPNRCFQRSGIAQAARSTGARLITARESGFANVNLQGDVLADWPVLRRVPSHRARVQN